MVDISAGGQIPIVLANIIGIVPLIAFSPGILSWQNPKVVAEFMSKPQFLLVATLAQNAIFFGISAGFIVWKYRTPLSEIGLPPRPTGKQVLTGVKLAIALMAGAYAFERLLTSVLKLTFGGHALKALEELTRALTVDSLFAGEMSWGKLAIFLLAAGIAAPIGEEMLFRGFLYNCAKRRFGVTAGVIISAAAFALIHLGPIAVVVIFVMGVLLALPYEK